MFWLIAHMWSLLLGAFIIGLLTGLWMRSGAKRDASAVGDEAPLGTLDVDAPLNTNS